MAINIQTENGLLLLADKTTKQTIEAALGYTPVKSSEIEDKYLSKSDASYNYLLKGEAAAQYLLKGDAQSIYATLNDLSNYLAKEEDGDSFIIADLSGNIIFKVDKDGVHSVNFTVNGERVAIQSDLTTLRNTLSSSVDGKIADLNASKANVEHTHDYSTISGAPDIKEDNSGVLQITDEVGHIAVQIDSNGLTATNLLVSTENGTKEVALKADLDAFESGKLNPAIEGVNASVADLNKQVTDLSTEVNTKIDQKVEELTNTINTKATKDQVNTLESSINSTISGLNASIASLDANKADKEHEHDYTEIVNAPNISETETNTLQVTDETGNIIMRVDDTGIDSVAFKVKGEVIEAMTDAEILAIVDEVFPPAEYSVEE